MPRRKFLLSGSAAALLTSAWPSRASKYPARPLRWIVGFPAGGTGDIVTRLVAGQLADQIGQGVVVENRTGAGGSFAVNALLAAPPDGHTLLLLGSSTIVQSLLQDNHSSVLDGIQPVASLTVSAFSIAVPASAPYLSLADLVAYAKANSGKLKVGSYGLGTQSHIAAQLFSKSASIEVMHVPYRGGAPLITDLLGKHIDVAFDSVASSVPYLSGGKLRVLAVTTPERLKELPWIPAASETVSGYGITVWTGVGVRKSTQPEIVQFLNREINAVLAVPKIGRRIADLALATQTHSVDEFSVFCSSDAIRTRELMQSVGIGLR